MEVENDFEYYTKVDQLQEFLREREEKRMELDQKFNKFTKSDGNRASKLQAYWKQLCEREKMSRARNQKLLQDFDRVEAHVAALAVRTDRLRLVQEQYRRQVDQRYPNWREAYMERLRQHQQSIGHTELQQDGRPDAYGSVELTSPKQQQIQKYHTHEEFTTRPQITLHDQLYPSTISPLNIPTRHDEEGRQMFEPKCDNSDHHSREPNLPSNKDSGLFKVADPPLGGEGVPPSYGARTVLQGGMHHGYHGERPSEVGMPLSNQRGTAVETGTHGRKLEIDRFGSMSPERGITDSSQVGVPDRNQPSVAEQESTLYEIPVSRDTVAHRQIFGSPSHQQSRNSLERGGDVSSRTEPFSSASEEDLQQGHVKEDGDDATEDEEMSVQIQSPFEKRNEEQISDSHPDRENSTEKDRAAEGASSAPQLDVRSVEAPSVTAVTEPEAPSRHKEDSDEDIESDLSLPLSDDEAHSSPTHEPDVQSGPELTTNGYLHLLQELENMIEKSDQHLAVYDDDDDDGCSQEQKSCIVKDANAKLPLDTYDTLSLSSVLIQELPLLVQASPRGYLISDQVLNSDRPILEVTLRSAITTNALPYWDRTLKHMVFLIKKEYFDPEEIAEKVAPLMVSKDSTMAKKAVRVVTSLLEDAAEEPTLDESSITQTSLEETPASTTALTTTQESKLREENKVPPLNLDITGEMKRSSDESDEDEDSFFDQDVPLKETDAYKQMLQNMQPKSGRDEDKKEETVHHQTKDAEGLLAELEESISEGDDEDIEKAAMVTPPTSGRSSGGRPKRNILSSLGGSDLFGEVKEDEGKKETGKKSWTPRDRSGEISSPEKSDIISSASETPREDGGYIPSAMDNSLKSSGRKSERLQRSSAFWGEESDLEDVESEMSVPMGTGGGEDDKDDFDFYD